MKLGSFTVSVTAVAAVLGVVLLEAVAAKRSKRPLVTEGCPKCDRGACPKVRRAQCPSLELIKDPCGCCKICASGLEERCGGFVWAEGVCGKGMVCVKYMQQFRAQVEYGEAGTCSCGDKESVCGADGRLYDDICHLRKENNERKDRGEPKVAETKMRTCGGAPKIKTRPENIQTGENGQFYLACEGEGIPIPEIYWTRDRKKLPSDEGNVSIQVRGGPMKNCVSSWVMVSTAMQKDAGEYICHVENNEGKANATATVTFQTTPKIKTRPVNVETGENGQFYLACEGEGIPIPEIYWTRDRKKLPSDEGNVSIQVRGGPMKNCVSSWVMVSTAMLKDAGEYICHVENNEGKANATATVTFQTS